MTDRLVTVITTSKLKLRSPSKVKLAHLSNSSALYSDALFALMKRAKERFNPEDFIKITFTRKKSRLIVSSLQTFTTWVNRELEIKKLQLNAHLKLGLIYHVSAALRSYAARFIKDVDSSYPFSNYMVAEEVRPIDEVLTEALTCVSNGGLECLDSLQQFLSGKLLCLMPLPV